MKIKEKISQISDSIYPFEVRRSSDHMTHGNAWLTIDLWDDFAGHFEASSIYADDNEEIIYRLIAEILSYENRLKKDDPAPLRYTVRHCSTDPLKVPDKHEYEKFKLMDKLQ